MKMKYTELYIKGVFEIEPVRYGDHRGYFCETFKLEEFRSHVGNVEFVQDNESYSTHGVLRGLHFQEGEWSQAKLVRVSHGRVLDVAVDLRRNSPTCGKSVVVELSAEQGNMLYIPRGFAHGFVVVGDDAQFQYKVDNTYHPEAEHTLAWDDPELDIDWRLPASELLLSTKDEAGMTLNEVKNSYLF